MVSEKELTKGSHVRHSLHGEGYITNVTLVTCDIIFERGGLVSFTKSKVLEDLDMLSPADDDNIPTLTLEDVENAMVAVLDKYNAIDAIVPLGERWENGTLILKPGTDTQPKEMPIETFFHKIVMLRDRLRVLEQNINSHKKLSDEEKVDLQQYITRAYGSLTSFNVLFKNKEDYFVGTGGQKE
ncbi:MAG: hypothetical protein LBH82_02940 [Bacteroidales bacterium]|jgi:hypothetical protein|nr:hypothetical protein [Bacteroidales bacterium]